MAYLINRTAAARIECLHALVRLIYSKYGRNSFSLNDVKFDRDAENIHSFCRLLRASSIVGPYCRFKDNPLDDAGCAITNGVASDTTKSKEVSNTVNALHALGFVERIGRSNRLTDEGVVFAQTPYDSPEMTGIIQRAVLNYGPVIGILHMIARQCAEGETFSAKNITVGYPSPQEYAEYKGNIVEISSGSKQDSNTRTKSCLLAWLTTAGYIRPAKVAPDDSPLSQLQYRSYINSAHRNEQEYQLVKLPEVSLTMRPLDFNNLTKLNSGLRERGMSAVREATMKYESVIKNRRFAIIYLLNKAYIGQTCLPFNLLIDLFEAYPEAFVISEHGLREVVEAEIEIAFMAGIPYIMSFGEYEEDVMLRPVNGLNMQEASIGAPEGLIDILDSVKL